MSDPDVSVLIVGYRSARFLPACLNAIPVALGDLEAELRFIDNGPDNGSAQLVRESCPAAKIIASRGNIGFAAANNLLADGGKGRWLLLLNPDTVPQPGSIARLVAAGDGSPEAAILAGPSFSPCGEELPMSRLAFPSLPGFARMIFGRSPKSDTLDAVSGAFMLVRADVWRALGGMDDSFFLYAEELDFCWRARRAGHAIRFVDDARVVHDVGSGGKRSPRRALYSLRGAAHFYAKHYSPARAWSYRLLHWIAAWARFAPSLLLAPFAARYRERAHTWRAACLTPWRWMRGYRPDSADPRRAG